MLAINKEDIASPEEAMNGANNSKIMTPFRTKQLIDISANSSGTGASLPTGGNMGEVLTKASSADGDVEWAEVPSSGGGSTPCNVEGIKLYKWDGQSSSTNADNLVLFGKVYQDILNGKEVGVMSSGYLYKYGGGSLEVTNFGGRPSATKYILSCEDNIDSISDGGKTDIIKTNMYLEFYEADGAVISVSLPTFNENKILDGVLQDVNYSDTYVPNYQGSPANKAYVDNSVSGKVDKETGKGLSTNDYTTFDKEKLSGVSSGADANIIEDIKVNGVSKTVTNKSVDISVPTRTSDITNDSNYVKDSDYNHTDNNYTNIDKSKLDNIESGADVNIIESVKVNGAEQSVTNKTVDIAVPMRTSELTNDSGFLTSVPSEYKTKTENDTLYQTKGEYATPSDISDISNNMLDLFNKFVSEYNTYTYYKNGDFCTYNGVVYRCYNNTTGSFDQNKWTEVSQGALLQNNIKEYSGDFLDVDEGFYKEGYDCGFKKLGDTYEIKIPKSEVHHTYLLVTEGYYYYYRAKTFYIFGKHFDDDYDSTYVGNKAGVEVLTYVYDSLNDAWNLLDRYDYQKKLTAGSGIVIEGDVISSTGSGETPSGTSNYSDLTNKPKINGIELSGNKTLTDLGIQSSGNYVSDAYYVHTDNNYTTLEKNKLAGLSNYNDTEVRGLIAGKVDNVSGKGLSTNDYTMFEKEKLSGIESGAEVNDLDKLEINGVVTYPYNKSISIDIPTKTSDIENDTGFITDYEETDPTVPAWAKASSKPSYSYNEITDKPNLPVNSDFTLSGLSEKSYNSLTDKPIIPTKTSDLTNDSGFVNRDTLDVALQNNQMKYVPKSPVLYNKDTTTTNVVTITYPDISGIIPNTVSILEDISISPELDASGYEVNLNICDLEGPLIKDDGQIYITGDFSDEKNISVTYDSTLGCWNIINYTKETSSSCNIKTMIKSSNTVITSAKNWYCIGLSNLSQIGDKLESGLVDDSEAGVSVYGIKVKDGAKVKAIRLDLNMYIQCDNTSSDGRFNGYIERQKADGTQVHESLGNSVIAAGSYGTIHTYTTVIADDGGYLDGEIYYMKLWKASTTYKLTVLTTANSTKLTATVLG